jgi:hypothetical protein
VNSEIRGIITIDVPVAEHLAKCNVPIAPSAKELAPHATEPGAVITTTAYQRRTG